MSNEGHSSAPGANVIIEHYCSEGCGKWGGLGFSASKTVETTWYCAEHYPYWNEIKAMDKAR